MINENNAVLVLTTLVALGAVVGGCISSIISLIIIKRSPIIVQMYSPIDKADAAIDGLKKIDALMAKKHIRKLGEI